MSDVKRIEAVETPYLPDEITAVYVPAALMPNGEVISFGCTIGWTTGYNADGFKRVYVERRDDDERKGGR
jgi:hypothetical protein